MRIEDINIRKVLTKTLQKTAEVEIKTKKGNVHSAMPVNKNGIYRIRSLDVEDATKKFLEIKRHFAGKTFYDMEEVDAFLHDIDVSVDFREIGGNLAFAISSAFLKSFARWEGVKIYQYIWRGEAELPTPLLNIANSENFEFFLYPVQQKKFSKSIMKLIDVKNRLNLNEDPRKEHILKTLSQLNAQNSLEIGIDFNAGDIWNDGKYEYGAESLTSQEQLLLAQDIASTYPVGYVEDPFHEDDFVLSSTLTHRLPTRLVVGGELYSNNFERVKRGIELKATSGMNAVFDQVGTISDLTAMVKEVKKHGMKTIVSGDSDSILLSNLAVGLGFDYAKLGKDGMSANAINELIRIEDKTS